MSDVPQSARERSYAEPERDACPYARCKKQPGDVYTKFYFGTQRPPRLPDEAGALCVIECIFDCRIRIYRIDGDPDHRRVEYDRGWTRPAP